MMARDLIGDQREELELLTTQDVARLLRVHENRIYEMVKDGRLHPVKVLRGRHRFRRQDVQALILRPRAS